MECSEGVKHSKNLFVVVEKRILRDIAEGILMELMILAGAEQTPEEKKSFQFILKYATTLAKLTE